MKEWERYQSKIIALWKVLVNIILRRIFITQI